MEVVRKRMIYTGLRVNRFRYLIEFNRVVSLNRHTISTTAVQAAKQKIQGPKKSPKPQQQYKTPSPRQPLSPTPPPPPPSPKQHPLRGRKFALICSGLAAFIFAGYSSYLFVLLNKEPIESSKTQTDVSSRYDTIASTFDSEVDWTEWSMGIAKMRKQLAQEAYGDVLEVSIGTGRNLEYYDWDFKGFNGVGKIQKFGGIKRGKVKSLRLLIKVVKC